MLDPFFGVVCEEDIACKNRVADVDGVAIMPESGIMWRRMRRGYRRKDRVEFAVRVAPAPAELRRFCGAMWRGGYAACHDCDDRPKGYVDGMEILTL